MAKENWENGRGACCLGMRGCLAAWPAGLAGFGLLHLFFSVQMAEEQREEGVICGGGASRPLNFI